MAIQFPSLSFLRVQVGRQKSFVSIPVTWSMEFQSKWFQVMFFGFYYVYMFSSKKMFFCTFHAYFQEDYISLRSESYGQNHQQNSRGLGLWILKAYAVWNPRWWIFWLVGWLVKCHGMTGKKTRGVYFIYCRSRWLSFFNDFFFFFWVCLWSDKNFRPDTKREKQLFCSESFS